MSLPGNVETTNENSCLQEPVTCSPQKPVASFSQKPVSSCQKSVSKSPVGTDHTTETPKKIIGEGLTVPSSTEMSATRTSGGAMRSGSTRSGTPLLPPMPKVKTAAPTVDTFPNNDISMPELPMAENTYDELSIIGTGAYGTVYKGREKNNPEGLVALKKLRMVLSEEGVPVNALREIALLKQLEKYNHPNIVKLLDICHGRVEKTGKLNLILVFEYVEQDLEYYMQNCPLPGIHSTMIQNLTHQIICGIDFLHSHRIIHRDLKPQNILVSRNNVVKICDFGLAKVYDFYSKLTTSVVTLWYRSPEVLLSNSYATPIDLWAIGCILAELYQRKPLFQGMTEGEQLQRIFNLIGKPTVNEWPDDVSLLPSNFRDFPPVAIEDAVPELTPEAADLLKRLLTFVPENRISAKDCLAHPYLSGLTVPRISPLNTISQQVLSYDNRLRGVSPAKGVGPNSLQTQEVLRKAKWELGSTDGSGTPNTNNPSNDENNPNAGNSTADSAPQIMTKSPTNRGHNQSPTDMDE